MNSTIKSPTDQVNLDFKTKTVKPQILFGVLMLFSFLLGAQPTITSFSPVSGAVGTTVSIAGTGFNTTPANNKVFFGATRATVTTATATNITVTVPTGATFAPVTVLNTATTLAAYSTQFFNPTFNPNKGSITVNDFATKVDFTTGDHPEYVVVGDMDGDGKPDLITANRYDTSVSVLRNTSSSGTVSFASKVNFRTSLTPISLAIGDIDGDGKLDIAVVNAGIVSILRNTSTSSGSISFATKVDVTVGLFPRSVTIGDIDGDGKPDLIAANSNSDGVSILRNTGSSGTISFATKVDFTTGSGPLFVAIGDMDGDGKRDLAIVNSSNNGGGNSVSVLRNTSSSGTVSFATNVDFATGIIPTSVAIGDIDGDGKPDLVITNEISTTVSVLQNTGSSGTVNFATKVDFTTGTYPWYVNIGDMDGDNKPDLVIANYSSSNVSVLRNTCSSSTISFATKVDVGYAIAESAAIGDIDGDGKLDLVSTVSSFDMVSVYRNIPQFSPTITTVGNLTPFSSCAGKTSLLQSFTVSGVGLTTNLVVTPPTGFEVSTTSGSGFGSSVSLPSISGTVNNTVIYIRLNNSATGSPSGNVVCSATGAPTQNIYASGLVKATSKSITDISICPSALPYTWNNRTYNTTKMDTVYFTNAVGCDSLTIINLNVKPISTSMANISICPSELPYTWNARTYNAAKTDTVYFTNSVGCDSAAIINLMVKSIITSTNNLSICASELPYSWNGLTFSNAGTQTKTGLINAVGCDSAATLNLTIKSTSSSTNNLSICSSALPYTWNGLTFNNAGTQTKTGLINVVGCDSAATLNLTIKSTSSSTNNLSICSSALPYTWNGLTFNNAGTQTKTGLTNAVGCDSSASLNLTVNPTPNTSNIIGLTTVTNLDTTSYSVTGTNGSAFNWIVTGATIQSGVGSNTIQVKWSITGTQLLNVTEVSNQGCFGVQKTLSVNVSPTTAINELKVNNHVTIYPNPFSETIHISLLNNQILDNVILYDLLGNEIISTHKNEIDASSLKSGVYMIMVVDQLGNIYNQKLIKN